YHFQVAFFQASLQSRARGERCDLAGGDIILSAQCRELVLHCLSALAKVIQLERQIHISQPGKCKKCCHHDPARQRCCVDRVTISSTRSVHLIFSATRNFALRDRGFAWCSSSLGSTGFGVTSARS